MRTILQRALVGMALLAVVIVASSSRAAPKCIPASQCCRVCDKGQACGNTCISREKQCHKGRGCACNASELCAE